MLLLSRVMPLVQPRVNVGELAPRGTDKSFVFDNISRYAAVIPGGKLSAPTLFYDRSFKGISVKCFKINKIGILRNLECRRGDSNPHELKRSHGPQPCVSTKFHHFGKLTGAYEAIPSKNKIYVTLNFFSLPVVSFLFQQAFCLRLQSFFLFRRSFFLRQVVLRPV